MAYEPRLIAPFVDSGLKKFFKPWIIGKEAFPQISDAYARRGVVRKREGYRLLASLPSSDKPVQGLKNWINPATLGESLVAFSLTKSYVFVDFTQTFTDITFLAFGGPGRTNPNQAFSWSNGSNDYFWAANYAGSMWVTNNLTADHIRFWNGTNAGGWSVFQPTISGSTQLNAALIILPYKGRLVVLNTTEGSSSFPSRARWSQIGTPYTSNTTGVNITNITPGNPTVVNIANTTGFAIGFPAGITGVIGTMGPKLNFNQFNVSAITPGVSITIDVDTTGLTYTSGGIAQGPGSTAPPSPFKIDIFAWRDDIPGRGGFVDADTSERIVSASIIKDTLIVAFQRSTWRLRYTGNEILPFIWDRINTQYGAESTYSAIPFDEACLFYSRYGWIASDTNNVERIDLDIPDDSFAIDATNITLSGMNKVQGIRDFYRNFAYWSYITIGNTNANQIYGYNYLDKSWTIFNPTTSINVFGNYRNTVGDLTWSSYSGVTDIWSNYNSPDDTWAASTSAQNIDFPYIVGGDLNGNVFLMFEFQQTPTADNGTNFNFNITTKRFNPYIDQGLKCRLGYVDLYCTQAVGGEITVQHLVDDQDSPILTKTVELFSRGVVNISNIAIGGTTTITTATPHGLETGEYATISDVVGSVGNILNGYSFPVTVTGLTTFTITQSTAGSTYVQAGYVYNADLPQGDAKYTRIYLGAIAHMHQLVITLSSNQLVDPVKGAAQFEMQGLVIWTKPCGRIRG